MGSWWSSEEVVHEDGTVSTPINAFDSVWATYDKDREKIIKVSLTYHDRQLFIYLLNQYLNPIKRIKSYFKRRKRKIESKKAEEWREKLAQPIANVFGSMLYINRGY